MRKRDPLLWILLVFSLAAVSLEIYRIWGPGPERRSRSGRSRPERLRDYAAELKANQLYAEAARVYDAYLEKSDLSDPEKARVDFNTAVMLLDQLGDAEKALAHFLRVTKIYREVDREILKQARKRSAECMERLGRSGAAQRELIAASELGATEETAEKKVEQTEILAEIGGRPAITRTEFEEIWKDLPQSIRRGRFGGPEGKKNFLKEVVATRLFSEAARRKGLDRDPLFQRRRRWFEDNLLSQKWMEAEVTSQVRLPESDLALFYKAHLAHYTEPPSVEIAHLFTKDATRMETACAAIASGSSFDEAVRAFSEDAGTKEEDGRLGVLRQRSVPLAAEENFDPFDVSVPGIGKAPEIVKAAFALSEIGEVTGPVRSSRGYHLIRLLGKTPGKQRSFQEVRHRVEAELRAQREEERRSALVEELMKTQKVRIHPDRLQ